MKSYLIWIVNTALCISLVACGGGGGGSDNNNQDTPFDLSTLEDTTISIAEDTASESIIGALSQATNTDFGADTIISVSGDTENIYVNNRGEISLLPGFSFDYETKNFYQYSITIDSEGQAEVTVDLQINVTDVVEGPRLQDSSFTVEENIAAGTLIGSVIPEGVAEDAFTELSLSGDNADDFEVYSNGDFRLAALVQLDADTHPSYTITLQGTNAANETSNANVSITVNQVNTVPLLENTSLSVDENSSTGTIVGLVKVTDDGGSSITSFELDGLGAGGFTINAQGQVSVSGAMVLDYETFSDYALSVSATNATEQSESVNLNIHVNDIEVPPLLEDTTLSVQERAPQGSYVGSVSILDTGESAINNFSLLGNAYNDFSIDDNGIISVAFDNSVSTETRNYYSLKAIASNQQGDSNEVDVTINIENLVDNNPPQQLQHLVHSDPVKYDFAGNALALLDDQLYVGIAQYDYARASSPDYSYKDAGTVAIFNDISAAASGEYKLKIADNSIALFNKFGSSVSAVNHASKGLLIGVGVEGSTDCAGQSEGEVWIYTKIDDSTYNYRLAACLSDDERDGANGLGHTLALGEDYFISGSETGERGVFLFSYDALGQYDGSNGFISKLRPANLASDSNLGESISLDGDYFVASASNDSSVSGIELVENTGAVYLYKYNPDSHSAELLQRIQASDAQQDDFFGQAVSISNNYIAIANRKNSVYLFKLNSDDTVTELSKVTHVHTEVDTSPMASVVFKDNLLIASVPSDTRNFSSYAGSAHIYALEDNSLVYKHTLEAEFPESSATYGTKLAFDGRYLAVSAPAEDNNSINGTGAVYVYDIKPDVKPSLTNYQQDILLKDNANFDNVYEFEADSPQGGPFTYTLSGQDSDKFTLNDNRLLAVSAFDTEHPEDSNGDNSYELIVSVTDSSGSSRAYALQVTVWQHQVMYYRQQRSSELSDDQYLFYGRKLQAKNGRLLVQESNSNVTGDGRIHNLLYEPDSLGQLNSTGHIIAPQNYAHFGNDAKMGNHYLALDTSTYHSDIDAFEYAVQLYPVLNDGSFGTPTVLEQQGDENWQSIDSIESMGDHLIVNLSGDTDESPSEVIYTIDNNAIAQRQGKYQREFIDSWSYTVASYYAENFSCVILSDTDSCRLSQLNTVTHQLDFLQDLAYDDIGGPLIDMGTNKQSGLDYMINLGLDSGLLSLHKFNTTTGAISFVNSIYFTDYEPDFWTYDFFNTKDLVVAANDGKIRIFQFNLTDDSFRHLGNIEDSRLENINAVEKIGNFLYFADKYANNNDGVIYIYELDADL